MKSLTFRYSITQFTYWAASSGAAAFATTYLLNKGVSSGLVGLMLAMAGLLSCLSHSHFWHPWQTGQSVFY